MIIAVFANPVKSKMLEEAAKSNGHQCKSFKDPDLLIETVVKGEYDCLLLDESIDYYDIFFISEKIKEVNEEKKLPIFLLPEANSDLEEVDLFKCGVDGILEIELNKENIIESIKKKIEVSNSLKTSQFVDDWVEFEIDNDLKYVKEVNRMIERLFSRSHLLKEELFKLEYSFREMIQNAWEHGNREDGNKKIKVSYVLFDDRLLIKIEDEGSGFILDDVEDPTIDPVGAMKRRKDAGKRAGGWGIASVKKIMDDLIYNEKGNTVLMVKYIN